MTTATYTHIFVKDVATWDLPACVDSDGSHDNSAHPPYACQHAGVLRALEPTATGGWTPSGPSPLAEAEAVLEAWARQADALGLSGFGYDQGDEFVDWKALYFAQAAA